MHELKPCHFTASLQFFQPAESGLHRPDRAPWHHSTSLLRQSTLCFLAWHVAQTAQYPLHIWSEAIPPGYHSGLRQGRKVDIQMRSEGAPLDHEVVQTFQSPRRPSGVSVNSEMRIGIKQSGSQSDLMSYSAVPSNDRVGRHVFKINYRVTRCNGGSWRYMLRSALSSGFGLKGRYFKKYSL